MARILVVDDDPVIIKLYQVILKKEGFEMVIAESGEQLMKAIATERPDVILLDVILPDDTGLGICARIKKNPDYSGIKIILVSGMEITPAQVAEGIETGADDYLTKPFDPKELLARIKNCVKLKIVEEELRDKNRELKDLANHLQDVREEERKFLAREVQEELGQLAAALKMDVDWLALNLPEAPELQLKRMAHASSTAKIIIQTIRRIASALRPSMLDELGLNASLEWLCKEFVSLHNIPCRFDPAFDDEGLSVEQKTALFRISQEALRNIAIHADATDVRIEVVIEDDSLQLTIADNGRGFDPANTKSNTMGIIGMRERALAINSQLTIQSEPGQGTRVCLSGTRE
ncbi:ATP-binding response regulator [Sediminibacterium soli]|uniref:ATP-binding response regulator n=1 Tax=Sediminibacterium soli TaxID=2698829 RepID=UPI00137AE91E|nr:response regulator [Sediminibacterium soli]NCI47197.1 response regulator [Sediminibacterium soli]